MKKIFTIISVSFMSFIVVFLSVLAFVKINIPIKTGTPYQINVFNNSTTGKTYEENSDELKEVYNKLNKTTKVSMFNRLVGGATLKPTINQDVNGKFAKYNTEMKSKNIVIELLFYAPQDLVVYSNNISRVISFEALLYVIPNSNKVEEIVVYYSPTKNGNADGKEKAYKECQPLILNGNPSEFIKYIKTLSK